jgi:hypothetical protein
MRPPPARGGRAPPGCRASRGRARHDGEIVMGVEQAPRRRAFGERQRRPHLEHEVTGGDRQPAPARRLDHARQDLMAGGRLVLRQTVVDAEHRALVFEDDAQRLAVELFGGLADLVDLGHVALGLRVGGHGAAGRHGLQAVRAHVGGAVEWDHAAGVLERPPGAERHEAQTSDKRRQQFPERLRDVRLGRRRRDGGDSAVDVTEQRPRLRDLGGGPLQLVQRVQPTDDRRSCVHDTSSPGSRSAYPPGGPLHHQVPRTPADTSGE